MGEGEGGVAEGLVNRVKRRKGKDVGGWGLTESPRGIEKKGENEDQWSRGGEGRL